MMTRACERRASLTHNTHTYLVRLSAEDCNRKKRTPQTTRIRPGSRRTATRVHICMQPVCILSSSMARHRCVSRSLTLRHAHIISLCAYELH